MKELTKEEQAFIEGTEFALDWGLPIPDEDFEKYIELTKNGGESEKCIDTISN